MKSAAEFLSKALKDLCFILTVLKAAEKKITVFHPIVLTSQVVYFNLVWQLQRKPSSFELQLLYSIFLFLELTPFLSLLKSGISKIYQPERN